VVLYPTKTQVAGKWTLYVRGIAGKDGTLITWGIKCKVIFSVISENNLAFAFKMTSLLNFIKVYIMRLSTRK
jgi:hypothetical protein